MARPTKSAKLLHECSQTKEEIRKRIDAEEKLKGKNINVLNVPEFFKQLKEKVDNYYTEKVDG